MLNPTISQITEDCSPLYHRTFDNGNPHFTGDALGFVEKIDENARQIIYGQMRRLISFLHKSLRSIVFMSIQ